jgi:DNA-directed RNA polymerase specialized sigma24 family protein
VQEQLEQEPERDAEAEAVWEQEYRQQRFRWAAERVRDHVDAASWQAFWQTAVDDRSAAAVALELGMSVGAVYTAKSRVLARIKQEIQLLQDE